MGLLPAGGGGEDAHDVEGLDGRAAGGFACDGHAPTLAGRSDDQTVSPNTHTNSVMVTAVMAINPIRLSQIPPRIIWPMVTYPEP